jgi:uncharacterized protein
MAPVRPKRRVVAVDILRGFAILGILLVNMLSFSGYFYTPTREMGAAHRLATLLIQFVAQAKFYTLFSFLFGWGMAIQMRRAAQRGKPFGQFYVRRLIILLLIGLVHAILIWEGDILVNYALLGLPLLFFRKRSDRTILIAAVVCILIPVLLSTPGPAALVREWHAGLVAPLRQHMMEGHQANVYLEGSYLEATVHRLKSAGFGYASFVYWAPHIFGMFLLGLCVGRRGIFHDISAHLPLFRRALWGGLVVGLVFNVIFVAASDYPGLFPLTYQELATRGARTIAGSALCLFYVSGIVLLTRKGTWRAWLSPLTFVGRAALSNYLFQSIICTLLFYGYGIGLYRKLGPAITIFLTLLLFRVQIGLSAWWLERYRFGPVEWLWRSLTYGPQPWKAEPGQSIRIAGASTDVAESHGVFLNGVFFVLQRLAFIAAVAFAIVYFCTVGLQLSGNSRLPVSQQRRSVWDVANPALVETIDFFEDLSRWDLGPVAPGVSERDWQPATQVLTSAYGDSARLLIVAVGVAAVIGIAAGALAAARRHSALALPMLTVTVVGMSIPSFFLALLIQIGSIAFYRRTGIRLVLFGSHLRGARSLLPKMALPALVLVARPLAHITRVTFVALSEVLEQEYVRTARAKGLREILVFWNHVLRNAGVSILTAVVVSLRFALGSLPVAEIFFDWPGLGITMLNGIFQRETSVVAGAALGLGITFLLINLSLDLIYRVIDPRLRTQNNGGTL